jgi:hypothetical protein
MEFEAFPKIPRLERDCIVTEKIDGTNGQIVIDEAGVVMVGSRNRWLSEKEDNYDFYKWVMAHRDALIVELGVGKHYGEWWGVGIGRKYNLFERRFSLFNTSRWKDQPLTVCQLVPVLYEGPFNTAIIQDCLNELVKTGSKAAPEFMKPEGVVIFHKASQYVFKKTIEKDSEPKGLVA